MFEDVTILIPAFNEERGIEQALLSAAPQCGQLIISDNASSDRTAEICREMAARYPHIEYHRQKENIGNARNSSFLFSFLKTPYFMFMGAHDYLAPNYVETLRALLVSQANAGLVAAEAKPFSRDGVPFAMPPVKKEMLASESKFSRVEFIARDGLPKYGAFLINGLMRADIYRECFDTDFPMLGGDILVLAKMAARSRILVSQETAYHCETRIDDSLNKYFQRLMSVSPDRDAIRRERSKYASYMYSIAQAAAGGNPLYLRRLIEIRMHLSINYAPFRGSGLADFLGQTLLKLGREKIRKRYFTAGSDTVLEETLFELRDKKLLDGKRLALYGAGLHTRRLLSSGILPLEAFSVIFDDTPGTDSMAGIPVRPTDSAPKHEFDILIISSDTVAEKLCARAKSWVPKNVEILSLYPIRFHLL